MTLRIVNSPVARLGVAAGYEIAEKRAKALGCSRVHLLNIERGAATASQALIGRMAGLYGVKRSKVELAIKQARKLLMKRTLNSLG